MRTAKIILYPIFGVFQFFIAVQLGFGPEAVFFVGLGCALIGLAIVNLRKSLGEARRKEMERESD